MSWLLLSANEESLAVIQIGNTTGVLFLLFLLLYWHMLSPHLILPVKTRIIFKSLNEVYKQPFSGMLSETTAVVKTQPACNKLLAHKLKS